MGSLSAIITVSPSTVIVGGTINVTCVVTNAGSLPISILGVTGTITPHSQNSQNVPAVSGVAEVGSGIPQNVPANNGTLTLAWTAVAYGPVVQDALGNTSWQFDVGAVLQGGDLEYFNATTATITSCLMDQYLALTSGNNQSAVHSTALTLPLLITLTHGDGTKWANVPVAFAVASGGGSVSSASVQTNALGQAQVTATLGSSPGANTFTATVTGATGSPVTFTATGT